LEGWFACEGISPRAGKKMVGTSARNQENSRNRKGGKVELDEKRVAKYRAREDTQENSRRDSISSR